MSSKEISKPYQVTVNENGDYFVSDLTDNIKTYDADGRFKGQWISPGSHVKLMGLAIDSEKNVLVGNFMNNDINKHKQDGSYLGVIKVDTVPRLMAVTSQNTLVIADWRNPPQIVSNNTGEVLHTLKHPEDESKWNPWGVYCQEDIILIVNYDTQNILCYSESGEYLGTIPISDIQPKSIALAANGRTLVVCENIAAKIYSRF